MYQLDCKAILEREAIADVETLALLGLGDLKSIGIKLGLAVQIVRITKEKMAIIKRKARAGKRTLTEALLSKDANLYFYSKNSKERKAFLKICKTQLNNISGGRTTSLWAPSCGLLSALIFNRVLLKM